MKQSNFNIKVLDKEYRVHYITKNKDVPELLEVLAAKDTLLSLDTETAALPQYLTYPKAALYPHLSSIRLLQIFDGRNAIVFDLWKLDPKLFIEFLETCHFIGHNSVFDLQFLYKLGAKKVNMGCTMLLAKLLIHATRPVDIRVSLEMLAENVLGVQVNKHAQKSDWTDETLTYEQIEYAALDPIYTLLIAEALAPGLEKYKMERIYKLCKDVQRPVMHIQLNGMGIDTKAHSRNIERWREEAHYAKMDVLAHTGLQKITNHTVAKWLEETVDESVLEIWPRTPKGKLSVTKDVFKEFEFIPAITPLANYHRAETLLSTFGDSLLHNINPETKRLHASYSIIGARTGRFTCKEPNLLNLPRDSSVRSIFVPREGCCLICADYSQIELRIAAELSQDKTMLKAFSDGVDIHTFTTAKILRKNITDVTKEERTLGKALSLGLLFGLGAPKFVKYIFTNFGKIISIIEGKELINEYYELYSNYREWQLAQAKAAEVSHKATTVCGKLRKLDADRTYSMSMNQPIQGSAAEVMGRALIRVQDVIDADPGRFLILNSVYDEMVTEALFEEEEYTLKQVEVNMVKAYQDIFPKGVIRGLVDAKSGLSWAEAK